YQWDTPSLWNHIAQELPARQPQQLDATQPWLLWRKEIQSMFQSLNPIQFCLYNAILQQATLSELAENLSEMLEPHEIPQVLLQNLQHWITQNVFSKIILAPD
ncbi:MAG TPA: hypothetical protein VFP93_01915, partial [Gammaproteobacteria bacterium]|nr:hypothetical protein [Gammaproteobacteria bacterium]